MLRRQYGVSPQISIKDRAVWFEWPRDLALDFAAVDKDVEKSSLKAREMHLIGEFNASNAVLEHDSFKTVRPVTMIDGAAPANGSKVTLDIVNFRVANAAFQATVGEMITPKVYQQR